MFISPFVLFQENRNKNIHTKAYIIEPLLVIAISLLCVKTVQCTFRLVVSDAQNKARLGLIIGAGTGTAQNHGYKCFQSFEVILNAEYY